MGQETESPCPSRMTQQDFVARFGGVYEHSPWVARRAWDEHGDSELNTLDGLTRALARQVDNADVRAQMELIRAHPDLGGRAAQDGGLTADSAREQAGAGIDRCTPEQYQRLQAFNAAYVDKFGFPFIVAVKGLTRADILAAMDARLNNDPAAETRRALEEIHKIARFRLQALI